MSADLGSITRVYDAAASLKVVEHVVDDASRYTFAQAVGALRREAGSLLDDADLRRVVGILTRLRFDMAASPLPAEAVLRGVSVADLDVLVNRCAIAYPSLETTLGSCLEAFKELLATTSNALAVRLHELRAEEGTTGDGTLTVALCDTRLVRISREFFADRAPGFVFSSSADLRAREPMQTAAAIGATRWFPRYVFTAPRAEVIHILRHAWVAEDWAFEPAFGATRARGGSPPTIHVVESEHRPLLRPSIPAGDLAPLDLLPGFADRKDHGGSHRAEADDVAEAIVVRLADGFLIFFEADDLNRTFILDVQEGQSAVLSVSVLSLEPGAYLLVRTSGGGDYVVDVANRILGDRAASLRHDQDEWKRPLRDAIDTLGARQVEVKLRGLGAQRASSQNIRNWASPRSIRPDGREDFMAILRLGDLAHRCDELWQSMGLLRRAHVRAGQEIRRELLATVLSSDLSRLEAEGRADIELPGHEAAFTIFRVEQVLADRYYVPVAQLDRPVEGFD
ncbi:MAG: hypothetical protein R3C39_13185 [Dehalococcoidia bacterium]